MKRVGLTAAAIIIAVLSLFLMYSQKLEEKVQLWTHYNIIYVSNDYSINDVLDVCNKAGVSGVISKENSLFSVKNRMVPTLQPYENEGYTSETIRDFFFHDKSEKYFLLYIPQENLQLAADSLKKAHISFGIDASVEYPILCPILCFAAFLLLMIINRVNVTKAVCLIPLVAVSYAVPFYSISSAVLCMLFIWCICDLYEKRNGAIKAILKKPALWIALAAGIVSAAFSGRKALLLFAAGIVSSIILFVLRFFIAKSSKDNCHFQPVLIINAKWINPERRYNLKSLLTTLVSCICFLVLSVFSGSVNAGIKSQDLLLPSPSGYTESSGFTAQAYSELSDMHDEARNPDLTDFLNEKWYAETAAYRKVNASYETVVADEKVVLPSFKEVDGLIVEKDKTLFKFNDGYISSAAEEFNSREGVERLLVSEEGFYSTGYATSGKKEISALIVPATMICAACFLILVFVYCIKRLKK